MKKDPTGNPNPVIKNSVEWPRWRVRLARLSPYTIEVSEQLDRLYHLTIVLTIVPGIMAFIVLSLFLIFGRLDIGLVAILIIFGPMIGLAWLDYRSIARQARHYLASIENSDKMANN